jgi:hypothetical protein
MEFSLIDIRQRHLRQFLINLKRYQPVEWEKMEDLPMLLYLDLFARSAADKDNEGKLSWFEDPQPDIDEMKYPELIELATAVAELYTKSTALDPN